MKYTPQRIARYALLCALSLGLAEPASAQIAATVAFAAGTVSALASAGAALVTLNRTGDASGAVIVSYTTIDGTAVAGTDYSATSGSLSWASGDSTPKSFVVPIASTDPGNRAFSVALISASGANFGALLDATVEIVATTPAAPPTAAPTVAFASSGYSSAPSAGAATITVLRSGSASSPVIVTYTTSDGTALAGTDYIATTGALNWAIGDSSPKSFSVPIVATGTGNKSFSVALISASGANFGAPLDAAVSISAAGASALSISALGNHLVDGNGNTLQLRGVNVSGLEAGSILGAPHPWDWSNVVSSSDSEPDWLAIAAWKVNAVRLPLNEASWLGLTTTDADGSTRSADPGGDYQATVIKSVNDAIAAGLYVILDLHWSAPAGFSPNAQNPFMDSDHSLAFWTSVANTFKSNPAVLFEPFNEPFLYKPGASSHGAFATVADANQAIRDGGLIAENYFTTINGNAAAISAGWQIVGYQDAIDTIRATGATNVLILGGQGYDNDESWWTQYPPSDSAGQLALTYHAYGGTFGYQPTGGSPQYTAAQSIAVLNAPGVPVILTEAGGPVGPGADTSFMSALLSLVDAQGWSITAWTWNPWNGANAGANTLIQDITNYTPTIGEGEVYQNWTLNHR